MKKRYQKPAGSALERFKESSCDRAAAVQLVLPLADVVGWAQQSVGELMRESFRRLIQLVMEDEVSQLTGEKHQVNAKRRGYRWGSEQGFAVVDGQKVPMRRPRVRDKLNREITLGSYELFQRSSLIEEEVWRRILNGLTTRRYEQVVQRFSEAYGLKKSAISKQFREASRRKLDELLTRPLGKLPLCAMLIDGTLFRGQNLIVALGIGCDGRKHVLAVRVQRGVFSGTA